MYIDSASSTEHPSGGIHPKVPHEMSTYLSVTSQFLVTNNVAKYEALIAALKWLQMLIYDGSPYTVTHNSL